MVFVVEGIPRKFLSVENQLAEGFYLEVVLGKAKCRGVFRTRSDFYNGNFLRKQSTAKSHDVISQKATP